MEHRYSPRILADHKLLIYKRSVPVALGRLRDINRDGLFIRSDYADIAVNQPLEIEFLSAASQRIGNGRFKSIVVHRRANGFGVEIAEDSSGNPYDLMMSLIESTAPGALLRYA